MEELFEFVTYALVEQHRLGPAFAGTQHVAIREAATCHQCMELLQVTTARQQVAHVNVYGIEAGAMESGRHFDVGVNALLAQYGNFRTRTGRNVRRCHVFLWGEGQIDVQTWVIIVFLGFVLLIGAFRVVAQTLHLPGGFGPPGTQRAAAFAEHRLVARGDNETIALLDAAQNVGAIAQAVLCQNLLNLSALLVTHLNHGAQLFIKQRGQCRIAQRFNVGGNAAVTGKGHFS